MVCGIYAIFDVYTHDCLYVGQSKDIESRWKQHIKGLRYGTHKRKEFISWFIEHGEDLHSIKFNILEKCRNDENIKNFNEAKWFVILKPRFYGKIPSLKEEWALSINTRNKTSQSLKMNYDKNKLSCQSCGNRFIPKNCVEVICKRCKVKCNKKRRSIKRQLKDIARKEISKTKTVKTSNRTYCSILSDGEIKKIINLYQDGLSLREVSSQYKVSYITIRNILKAFNIPMHTSGFSSKKRKDSIKAYGIQPIHRKCLVCGQDFSNKNTPRKTCSKKCYCKLQSINNYKRSHTTTK